MNNGIAFAAGVVVGMVGTVVGASLVGRHYYKKLTKLVLVDLEASMDEALAAADAAAEAATA